LVSLHAGLGVLGPVIQRKDAGGIPLSMDTTLQQCQHQHRSEESVTTLREHFACRLPAEGIQLPRQVTAGWVRCLALPLTFGRAAVLWLASACFGLVFVLSARSSSCCCDVNIRHIVPSHFHILANHRSTSVRATASPLYFVRINYRRRIKSPQHLKIRHSTE